MTEEKLNAAFETNITFNAETSLTCAKSRRAKGAHGLCFSLVIKSTSADKKYFLVYERSRLQQTVTIIHR